MIIKNLQEQQTPNETIGQLAATKPNRLVLTLSFILIACGVLVLFHVSHDPTIKFLSQVHTLGRTSFNVVGSVEKGANYLYATPGSESDRALLKERFPGAANSDVVMLRWKCAATPTLSPLQKLIENKPGDIAIEARKITSGGLNLMYDLFVQHGFVIMPPAIVPIDPIKILLLSFSLIFTCFEATTGSSTDKTLLLVLPAVLCMIFIGEYWMAAVYPTEASVKWTTGTPLTAKAPTAAIKQN